MSVFADNDLRSAGIFGRDLICVFEIIRVFSVSGSGGNCFNCEFSAYKCLRPYGKRTRSVILVLQMDSVSSVSGNSGRLLISVSDTRSTSNCLGSGGRRLIFVLATMSSLSVAGKHGRVLIGEPQQSNMRRVDGRLIIVVMAVYIHSNVCRFGGSGGRTEICVLDIRNTSKPCGNGGRRVMLR